MLKLAQRSTDELFSIALYNWLIQVDLMDKLLQVSSSLYNEIVEGSTELEELIITRCFKKEERARI